jgi:hypothetical protein
MEAAMLEWLRNLITRQEPKKKQEQPLACPSCDRWASKENRDRAQVTHAGSDLTCEICGAKRLLFDWAHAGAAKRGLEPTVKAAASFQDRVDEFMKKMNSRN